MQVDLLVRMDDDLIARLETRAATIGLSAEELVRKVLLDLIGCTIDRPRNDTMMRPMVTLDLRT